jgi:hypothetical protein
MFEGVCYNCGSHYFEWELQDTPDQRCEKCGAGLDIWYGGQIIKYADRSDSEFDLLNWEDQAQKQDRQRRE